MNSTPNLPARVVFHLCLLVAASGCSETGAEPDPEPSLPDGWIELAPMPVAKVKHTAVLLDDGRVLVVGGEYDDAGTVRPSSSAEIYDPATDTWTVTTPMTRPRVLHGTMVLYDGRVLVWGGYDTFLGGLNYLNNGEIFDPATEQWTPTAEIGSPGAPSPRLFRHNGEHLIVVQGGIYEYDTATDTVFPASFTTNGVFNLAGASFSIFPDGGYLVSGGDAPEGNFNTRYVDGTDVFDQVSHGKHAYHATLVLDDRYVLLLGGVDSRGEVFDRETKQWELLSHPIASRDEGLFFGKPGKVISFGGDQVGEFDVTSRTFTEIPRPEPHRFGADGNTNTVQLADGNLWVCGGWSGDATPQGFSDQTFLYEAMN